MKKYILVIILVCFNYFTHAQYQSYQVNLKGNAKALVSGQTDVLSAQVPSGTKILSFVINASHPTAYYVANQNSQTITNYGIYCTSNNFNAIEETDNYENYYTKFTLDTNTPQTSSFSIWQDYSATTEAKLDNGFSSSSSFPITSGIPSNILSSYTQPTSSIQSNDPYILAKAQTLTSGCQKVQDAVEKIEQWICGSINYISSSSNNADMTASLVFNRVPKSGNCAGFSNLLAAMLRSVGIPARVLSGAILKYPYTISYKYFKNPLNLGDKGPGSHAVCEIYYPDKGWVMIDPQGYLNFSPTHFIRFQQLPDLTNKSYLYTNYSYSGAKPAITITDMCGIITSMTNNYSVDNYSPYQTLNPNSTLLNVFKGTATGINDKIAITNGTSSFKTGDRVSYGSSFTSYAGNTWPINRYWSINLYHTTGTYQYAYDDGNSSYWDKTTAPVLPNYQWLLDANGRIFGEVSVTATLNDGDMIGDKMPLSIERCNELTVSNQTFSSNATISGCYITMGNVTVQNNSALVADSEMGITINPNFEVSVGSTFETK